MHGVHLRQPYVAIYARTFVEPAVTEAGIHSQDDVVPAAVIQEVGEIETERSVAIVVASDEATVHKHKHIAKGTIELDQNAAAEVARWNFELAPVPAHAVFGIPAAERLKAVGTQRTVSTPRVLTHDLNFLV